MNKPMSRKLRGDHCACPTCAEYFNSTRAFDKHRSGEWTARRCLSPDEMRAKGMDMSTEGWWLSSRWQRPILPTHAIQGAAIGIDPLHGQGVGA
jgi:hypothetical protein